MRLIVLVQSICQSVHGIMFLSQQILVPFGFIQNRRTRTFHDNILQVFSEDGLLIHNRRHRILQLQ